MKKLHILALAAASLFALSSCSDDSVSFSSRSGMSGGSVLIIKNSSFTDKVEAHVVLKHGTNGRIYEDTRTIDPRDKDEFGSLQLGSNIPAGSEVDVTIYSGDVTEKYHLKFTGPNQFDVTKL